MFDYLIVGAGFAGSVLAERLANGSNKKVLICDKRPHIGGNAYDHYNHDGILVHKYGPHIFHTNSKDVFEYLGQFTQWRSYEHRVLASVDGQLVPIPINQNKGLLHGIVICLLATLLNHGKTSITSITENANANTTTSKDSL